MTVHLPFKYNSAFLYRPDGQKYPRRYDKIHLVLFGEFMPFRKTLPVLFNLLMKFTPYDFDYSLDAGSEYTVFEMNGREQQGRTYRFSVMICYEDTVPDIARRFALDDAGQKRIDWLVNISNDGWFVRFKWDPALREANGNVFASTELVQHTAICVFRAVENRLSVVRSVNTGVSCLIDSVGRVRDGFTAGDLPSHAMARRVVAGWFVDRVPIDERITFFSRFGQWLDFCCAIGFVSVIIVPLLERFFRGKKQRMT
jgi:apolipoprotein N-acyltransferase